LPELPEVETIAQGLRPQILDIPIVKLHLSQPAILAGPFSKCWSIPADALQTARIQNIRRRGKRLLFFTDRSFGMIVQLGMTGNLGIVPTTQPKTKHTHFIINFINGNDLRFIDPRRFGRLWFVEALNPQSIESQMLSLGFGKLGPEPWDITLDYLTDALQCHRPIKSFLLDQQQIAGLGNIYADEALFLSAIRPQRLCRKIKPKEIKALRLNIRKLLRRAIRLGGTTFNDYRNAYGHSGDFQNLLNVYQQTGQPCPRCGYIIKKIVIAGRSSHFCPKCQL